MAEFVQRGTYFLILVFGVLQMAGCTPSDSEKRTQSGRLTIAEKIDGLRLAIHDDDAWVRWYAYEDLIRLATSSLLRQLSEADRQQILHDLEQNELELLESALKVFARVDYRFLRSSVLRRIHELANSKDIQIRIAALEAIAAVGSISSADQILNGLKYQANSEVRIAAIRAAGALVVTPSDLDQAVLNLVDDVDEQVQEEVLVYLGRDRRPPPLTPWIPHLILHGKRKQEMESGRKSADVFFLERLKSSGDPRSCLALLRALEVTGLPEPSGHPAESSVQGLASYCDLASNMPMQELPDLRDESSVHTWVPCGAERIMSSAVVRSQVLETLMASGRILVGELPLFLSPPYTVDAAAVLDLLGRHATPKSPVVAKIFEQYPDLLGDHQSCETQLAAVRTAVWAKRSGDYTAGLLNIITRTEEAKDPFGILRQAALNALQFDEAKKGSIELFNILIEFLGRHRDNENLRDSLVQAYWRNEILARDNLSKVAARMDSKKWSVKQGAIDVLTHEKNKQEKYIHDVWTQYNDIVETGFATDKNGIIAGTILQRTKGHPSAKAYLPEVASMLSVGNKAVIRSDPIEVVRLSAIDFLTGSDTYNQLYSSDLVRLFLTTDSDEIREKSRGSMEGWLEANPEDFIQILDESFAYGKSYSAKKRYLALYFGGSSKTNRRLMDVLDFSSSEIKEPMSLSESKEFFSTLARLVELKELQPRLRSRLAFELFDFGYKAPFKCSEKTLVEHAVNVLRVESYEREAEALDLAKSFDDADCTLEYAGRNVAPVLILAITVFFVIVGLRGFKP